MESGSHGQLGSRKLPPPSFLRGTQQLQGWVCTCPFLGKSLWEKALLWLLVQGCVQVCGHCGQSLLWGWPCSSLLTNWSGSSQNIRRLSRIGPGPGSPVAWSMKALEHVAAWPPTLMWPWACHFCDTVYSAIKWDNNASSMAHTVSSKASYFFESVFLWPVFSPCPLCFHHADPFNIMSRIAS